MKIYEELKAIPEKWKGPAFICPAGHNMHPDRYTYCIEAGFKDAHCKGGCGWVDQKVFTFNEEKRDRTEGFKVRMKDEQTEG